MVVMANGVKNALDRIGATQAFTSFINKAAEKSDTVKTVTKTANNFGFK